MKIVTKSGKKKDEKKDNKQIRGNLQYSAQSEIERMREKIEKRARE